MSSINAAYLFLSVVGGDVERGVLGDRVHPPVGAALDQVGHHVAVTVLARLKKSEKNCGVNTKKIWS